MKAIQVKYYGPTEKRGSRLIATDSDNNRAVTRIDLSTDDILGGSAYLTAAEALRDKMGWKGELIGGWLKNSMVFVLDSK